MSARPHINANLLPIRDGILLAVKRLDVAFAVLVEVIDDKGFPDFAAAGCPFTLSDRHGGRNPKFVSRL